MRNSLRNVLFFLIPVLMALPMRAIVPSASLPVKGDVYLGFSRLGANTYYSNVGSLYGWEGSFHLKVRPFVGVEADAAQYGYGKADSVPRSTVVMLGPRVTVGVLNFKVFGHALGGFVHTANSSTVSVSENKWSYGLGGGAEFPIAPFFAWRFTGDYLGKSGLRPAGNTPARFSTGLVFKF